MKIVAVSFDPGRGSSGVRFQFRVTIIGCHSGQGDDMWVSVSGKGEELVRCKFVGCQFLPQGDCMLCQC